MFGHVVRGPLLLLKVKWLDEDPEKISVLRYVATFKEKQSRCFEPEDRVLVLFTVVGNPLQAKYSERNKVVKKISDTNHLVRTPGGGKETQVCHINMLKAYHEKQKPELVRLKTN